ncbi:unnamed protein product [Phytophthora fragariaefolia]|uniref:Unnamed protein product n=1 Tax=Phytophthora fragariaefolia TaxID=1490495 RepID=A0A9W6XSA8_9STRA|nr:unnamed protein product [Phytophthora fragariaefolia]
MVISSTSWTADEDFGILLTALEILDKRTSSLSVSEFPNLLVVVTGKGPQKEMYLEKIRQLAFKRIPQAQGVQGREEAQAPEAAEGPEAAAQEAAEGAEPQAAERQEDGARARVQGRRTCLQPARYSFLEVSSRPPPPFHSLAARQGQRRRGVGQAPVGDQQAAARARAGRQEGQEARAQGAAAAAQDVGGAQAAPGPQEAPGRPGRVQHHQPLPHAPQEV